MKTIITYATSLKFDEKTAEWVNDYRPQRIVDGPIRDPNALFDNPLGVIPTPGEILYANGTHARYLDRKRRILRRNRKNRKIREWFEDTDTLDTRYAPPATDQD